jgi:hypothetical protein
VGVEETIIVDCLNYRVREKLPLLRGYYPFSDYSHPAVTQFANIGAFLVIVITRELVGFSGAETPEHRTLFVDNATISTSIYSCL